MAQKKTEASETPKKKSKFKLIMIILALLLLVGGAVGGFWWFTMRDTGPILPIPGISTITGDQASSQGSPATSSGSAPPKASTSSVALPTVTVNLTDPSGTRYLRVGMEVEVSSPDAIADIQNQNARIRDAIIILLSSKTYAELATADGKIQVKNEVASRLNQILGSPKVVRIYFTEFVVQ